MQVGMDISLGQSQKLVLTPQIEYSLNVLKMSTEELNDLIEEEVLSNPLLTYSEADNEYQKPRVHLNNDNYRDRRSRNKQNQEDVEEYMKAIPDDKTFDTSLKEFLLLQLHVQSVSKGTRWIAEFLINCIEESGYLKYSTMEMGFYIKYRSSSFGKNNSKAPKL